MCTVSLVPFDGGFRIGCNRDERLTRALAEPPTWYVRGDRRAVYPRDPEGGGTWIGANADGLAAVLLNRSAPERARSGRRTRGEIVLVLLAVRRFSDAVSALRTIDPRDFAPFAVVVVQNRRLGVGLSDGFRLSVCLSSFHGPLVLASSSLGDALVERPRRALFQRLVAQAPSPLVGQSVFHSHHWPDRPELSVVMTRGDARTVSRTFLEAGEGHISMTYEAL